jgi:thiol:disulfide interchange protein DsbC
MLWHPDFSGEMMNKKFIAATALLASFSIGALAGEAEVKKALEATVGKVEKISKAPIPGMWEVTVGGQIFYADDKGTYLLAGNLIEIKTGKNLTSERQFNALPLELAFKQVRGNGKNVLVTFEDPNCGYCKKLAKELQSVQNLTLYTFLYPVLGEDSTRNPK